MLEDPMKGLSEEDVLLMKEVKMLFEVATTQSSEATKLREEGRQAIQELRNHHVSVGKIARYLGVSSAYIYQITH